MPNFDDSVMTETHATVKKHRRNVKSFEVNEEGRGTPYEPLHMPSSAQDDEKGSGVEQYESDEGG